MNNYAQEYVCYVERQLENSFKRHQCGLYSYEEKFPELIKAKQYVYFLQAENDGNVKVGTSLAPNQRCDDIQRMSPVTLKTLLVVPGSYYLESKIHSVLNNYRLHGEWFYPHRRVFIVMRYLRKKYGDVQGEAR